MNCIIPWVQYDAMNESQSNINRSKSKQNDKRSVSLPQKADFIRKHESRVFGILKKGYFRPDKLTNQKYIRREYNN